MADSFVRVPADDVGKRVDASSLDVGVNTVYRQRIVIADNSATDQYAVVTAGALVITGNVNLSATAVVAFANPPMIQAISATVVAVLGAGTANIGTLQAISATVNASCVLRTTGGTAVEDTTNNALRVNVVAGSAGGPSKADNETFSLGAGASSLVPIGALRDDTGPASASEGAAAILRMTEWRALHVNLRNASGSAVGTTADPLIIDLAANAVIGAISATVTVAGVVALTAGSAVIGALDFISRTVQVAVGTPFTVNAISATVAAAIATSSFVSVRAINGQLGNESAGTAMTVKTAFTSVASSGNNTFIAGIASTRIRVLGYRIQAQGTVAVRFTATSSGANLSQLWTFQAREGTVVNAPFGAFEFQTSAGEGVQINLSGAVTADVSLVYVEVT